MPFVKLDCDILNSSVWIDRDTRDVWITALLLAVPREFREPVPQLRVRALEPTGWSAPVGWYGFVPAASTGIIHRAMVPLDTGLAALERMGEPEPESRSQKFDGRRLVRVDGGFLVLTYMDHRDRDHGATERSRRFRERQRLLAATDATDATDATRDATSRTPLRTQAEAEAEAEAEANAEAEGNGKIGNSAPPPGAALTRKRKGKNGTPVPAGLDRLLKAFAVAWEDRYARPLMLKPHWRRLASQLLRSRPPSYPAESYVAGLVVAAEAYLESGDAAACRVAHDFGDFFRQAHAYLPAPDEL